MDHDERIRQRAHEIWESEGRPEGREAEHWSRAEEELRQELNGSPAGDAEPELMQQMEARTDQVDGAKGPAKPAARKPRKRTAKASAPEATADETI